MYIDLYEYVNIPINLSVSNSKGHTGTSSRGPKNENKDKLHKNDSSVAGNKSGEYVCIYVYVCTYV
jgi:hypothetical protein